MACSLQHLQLYNEEGNEFLVSIVMGDETWALYMTLESKVVSMVWKHPSSPSRKKFKVSPSTRKLMLTVFWDMKGVLLAGFLPHGSTVNSATLTKPCHAIHDKNSATNQHIRLLHDNARLHVPRPVREKLQGYIWGVLEHPPYSPNLAPSDFHLFVPMKKFLSGRKFDSDDELKWVM
ncbi:Mariner Mos1 transposase [Araneus ventricosus]|uniref:Mariner Mos1 transposase n=1 Tax=Araneus ventricosus TaxID=182803 RepID=A0A4Y2FGY6_ARAVE|nr:Mariner Mos1 transposase [Araneus ventricosus]